MTYFQKLSIFLLRVSLGWLFFYAGISKIFKSDWTSAGYIKSAKNFIWFYEWLLSPDILPTVNFLNKWGLTLLGISLILGIMVRLSSALGTFLMLAYYLVILDFPYPNPNSFLVDQHIIFIFVLILFFSLKAGRVWGLEQWCLNLPICRRFSKLRKLFG